MEQRVRVRETYSDGTAQVLHIRESACSGDCHKCAGCGAAKESLLLTAGNPIGAKPGDFVIIRSETGPVLAAAAMLYLMPLAFFVLGYLVGEVAWKQGELIGCGAFLLSIALVVLYDRQAVKKKKIVYTITGYAEDPEKRG